MSTDLALRIVGVLIMLAGLLLSLRETRRAYEMHRDTLDGRGWFVIFLARRREPEENFTPDGWRHWKRAGWLFPVTWLLGGLLILASA